MLNIKDRNFVVNPEDYERGGTVQSAAIPAQPLTPGPKTSDSDRLPDPRGSWEEVFYFEPGVLMLTPELPRRGATHVIAVIDRAPDVVPISITMRSRGPRPDAGDVQMDNTDAGAAQTTRIKTYGPAISSTPANGNYSSIPIPSVFRIGIHRTSAPVGLMVAPAGGAWLKVIGVGPARAFTASPSTEI